MSVATSQTARELDGELQSQFPNQSKTSKCDEPNHAIILPVLPILHTGKYVCVSKYGT